jgi:Peptidase family M28
VLTVNYLLKRANQIKADYANLSEVSIDLQVVSGVHFVSAHYRNIQNVVVKLHGKSEKALMINCHFDSEYGSFGAGDDGVNCCIMLEILRVLAKSGEKQDYSIIFLFNGSEEGNLEGIQASHGFITQHKWSKDIKAYINLEAQGVGGRELLFRSGPKNDWLIKKYRQSVSKPFGQVFAEEMFETNVLKSGTDFESFRDAGDIPGVDLSYCHEGWKYHSKFDHIRYVTNDSIQNTGNNVLELTKKLANSEELNNPPEGNAAVYFDMWGLFFVSYSAAVGVAINIVISVLAVVVPFLVQTKMKLKNFKNVMTETLLSFLTVAVSTTLSLAACITMGFIMNAVDNTMFWFNATLLSLGVYSALAVTVQVAIHHISYGIADRIQRRTSKKNGKFDERKKLQIRLNGINLFWAMFTITLTSFGLRFVYITMIMLLISLITNCVTYCLHKVLPTTRELTASLIVQYKNYYFNQIRL